MYGSINTLSLCTIYQLKNNSIHKSFIDPNQNFLEEINIENDEFAIENWKTMKFKKENEKLISNITSKYHINDELK